MKSWLTAGLKAGFQLMARGEYRRFLKALENPRASQAQTLSSILASQAKTEMGRELGLNAELSIQDFQKRVPLSHFDDPSWSRWYQRQQAAPKKSILVPGGVSVWETTSGSSGQKKQIPYNKEMRATFERYFKIWAYDLLANGSRLESLKIFMSLSPALRDGEDLQGFSDDSEYLSPILRVIVQRFLAVPLNLKSIRDPDEFRDSLCVHLLLCEDLEVISVWHPSFFTLLWGHIQKNRMNLAALLLAKSSVNSAVVAQKLMSDRPLSTSEFWPHLKFISAWDSGQSHLAAVSLAALFPKAVFQGKGLLATEAAMTLPLLKYGSVPYITDCFFEFRDSAGDILLLDQLKIGDVYEIIITQRGGLLRYCVGDLVRVKSLVPRSGLPVLDFVSRLGDVSDLVGEKLNAAYFQSFEDELARDFGAHTYCVLPLLSPEPRYIVITDLNDDENRVAAWWDAKLSRSFHFGYARKLEQLKTTSAIRCPNLPSRLIDFYMIQKNMRQGDIKLKTLIRDPSEAADILRWLERN